jgi:hypothetical protein
MKFRFQTIINEAEPTWEIDNMEFLKKLIFSRDKFYFEESIDKKLYFRPTPLINEFRFYVAVKDAKDYYLLIGQSDTNSFDVPKESKTKEPAKKKFVSKCCHSNYTAEFSSCYAYDMAGNHKADYRCSKCNNLCGIEEAKEKQNDKLEQFRKHLSVYSGADCVCIGSGKYLPEKVISEFATNMHEEINYIGISQWQLRNLLIEFLKRFL